MQEFSDITIPGEAEYKPAISPRPHSADELIHGLFPTDSPYSTFFRDMQEFVLIEGKPATFTPFNIYLPTYEQMSKRQQAWYFYWRDQVRQGNYVDTDLSYILLLIYEIISNVGWRTPQDGYEYLVRLLSTYQNKFPTLNLYLPDWAFDFAESYGLAHTLLFRSNSTALISSTKIDILVEQHADDVPLGLPFALIDALCTYSVTQSPFYNDGNQELMQEAIPKIVAFLDAVLRKKTNEGILEIYGPKHPKEQEYYAFRNALCPNTYKKIKVIVKAYSTNQKLREYITEIVQYGENVLRELKGYHDRLEGITIDHETAKLIAWLLREEYEQISPKINEDTKNAKSILHFDGDVLVEKTDTIPKAFQIEETSVPVENTLLTSNRTISNEAEHKQIISPQTMPTYELIHSSFLENCSESYLFSDMLKYASLDGKSATFVPFDKPQPTYTDMNMQQQAWYFYWRSQVRQDNYLNTDLSYILLYLYEILNGVGWRVPQKGYECLLRIMLEYQNTFPYLDQYLPDWIFDFAQLHGIKHTLSLEGRSLDFIPHPKLNLFIDQYADDIPLKLPFELIESLCNLSYEKNKFYDGNKALIWEAIPRTVALVDAFLRKKTKKGFLQTYGPEYQFEQNYYAFEKAYCLKPNRIITVTVKAYTVEDRLRGHMTQLVRYTENMLRDIKGYRSRLYGGRVDGEIAKIVKLFLKQEYGQNSSKTKTTEKVEITLNFKDIAILKEQSDAVRAALKVEEATLPVENEENENQPQLLEVKTVSTLCNTSELSDTVREFIEYLTPLQQKALHAMLAYEQPEHKLKQIAEEAMTMPQILLDEINETALQILGDLVVETMDQEFRVLDEYIPHLKQYVTYKR